MNNTPVVDFVIDFESLSTIPNSKVIDLSAVPFVEGEDASFKELVSRGIQIKFDLRSQTNRVSDEYTIAWWKSQCEEAKKALIPSDSDVTIKEGVGILLKFLEDNKINRNSHMFSRGMSFDFPILVTMLQEYYGVEVINTERPYKFWNERDIRTAIESTMGVRDQTTVPLPKGVLDGFVKHNSIHDCAKDIIMMNYAKKYAYGLMDIPEGDNIDPLSVK